MSRALALWAGAGAMLALVCGIASAGAEAVPARTDSYAATVQKIAPSVVSIFSVKAVAEGLGGLISASPAVHEEESLGSGVIVTADGYILTNFHVVKDAEEINVVVPDSETKYSARIVGMDPATDLALIKITASNLHPATLGDSDQLPVGDVCFAVGDPFGVGQTVTMGIVSATGRSGLGISDYENFIQTDAAINPGNSGGALANEAGEVVGINTAIVSASRGGEGVGFAVPSNTARRIMEDLRRDGRVIRSFLGVILQPLNPDLVGQFGLKSPDGALVGDVTSNSPAARAGVLPGDTIVEFNGKLIADPTHLRLLLSRARPHTRVNLGMMRNGKEIHLPVLLEEAPRPDLALRTDPRGAEKIDLLTGVSVADLDQESRRELRIPTSIMGVLVVGVDVESPAFADGLKPGDVIEEINRRPVKDAHLALRTAKAMDGGLLLRIYDEHSSHYVEITRIGRMDDAPIEPVKE